ncbi:hypothetical protein EQH57_0876 [Dictyocoela roeselum]|nr:hypothetical protein EQH57_0876 [Dictyocoela roeselum]
MNINLEELSQDIQVMDKYMNCFLQKECGVQLKVVFTMQFNFCGEGSYNTYFMRSVKSHDSTSANRNITFINHHNSVESNRVVVGKNTAFIPIYVIPPNKDIDESFKFKYTTAELIVSQIAPIHFRSVDPWLSVGAHEYLIDVLLTQIFGRNDFLYNQRSDIDFVVENDIFEYSLADKRRTIKDINSLFFKKKSCQVYHMIEKYTSRAFMQKILSELIKEHENPENEIHMHKIPESGNFKSHHKKILNRPITNFIYLKILCIFLIYF